MALVISTKDQLYLTGLQHRAVNKSTSITQGAEILNAGNKMLVTIKGGTTNALSIATGFAVLSGVLVENSTVVEKTFGNPSTAGSYVLVLKIDMSTNTPSLNTQLASVSRTTNDLTVTNNGIYEYVLATMTVSATGVISNLVSATPYTPPGNRVPVGSVVQQGVAMFLKLASDQALSNGVNAKIALVKQVGDLAVASNEITLPAGFYYEITFGVGNSTYSGTGAVVVAKVVKSDGTPVGNGSSVTARGVTTGWGAGENQVGYHFIDLTSGVQTVIKLNTTAVEGNQSLLAENTWMVIKQKKRAV